MNDLKPMKMTDLAITSAEKYLVDPDWVLEQKMDGARALIHVENQGDDVFTFQWFASGGGPMKFAAALLHLEALEAELTAMLSVRNVAEAWLDGELMPDDGTLRLFDLPYLRIRSDQSQHVLCDPNKVYAYRRGMRDGLFADHTSVRVVPVRTAFSVEEKRDLWEEINTAGVEGGMLKNLGSPYESGVRTKNQLKLKLVKTADVVVTSAERKFDHKGMVTHGSAGIAVRIHPSEDPKPYRSAVTGKRISSDERDRMFAGSKTMQARALAFEPEPRSFLPIGAASLIGKDLTIKVGSVVEVNYLFFTGDAIVQPRIMRKRLPEEKTPEDCWIDQLPVYSKRMV